MGNKVYTGETQYNLDFKLIGYLLLTSSQQKNASINKLSTNQSIWE